MLVGCLLVLSGWAEAQATLERGRLAYQTGAAACARCHGRHGEGRREGAVAAPALQRFPGQKADLDSLRLAVNDGLSAGRALHRLMPRYDFDAGALADLSAYLDVLGSEADADPGIGSDTLMIGVRLDASVVPTVQASFAQINAAGGIYGRRLVLQRDAGAAVFAMLGWGRDVPPATPSIAPSAGTGAGAFGLVPGSAAQAHFMLDQALAAAPNGATVALSVAADTEPDTVRALQARAAARGIKLVPLVGAHARGKGAVSVLSLGDGAHLAGVAHKVAAVPIYALAMQAGRTVFVLAPDAARRLRLVAPAALSYAGAGRPVQERLALGAVAVLVEALKRSGRRLDRETFVHAIEQLRGFGVDGLPVMRFGPNRHVGVAGMLMVKVDLERRSYLPYTDVSEENGN
jgi:cytochrome c553